LSPRSGRLIIARRFIAGIEWQENKTARKAAAEICRPLRGPLTSFVNDPSAEALGYSQSSATRTLPAAVLTILLHFFCAPLTNFALGLERNDPAPISRNLISVGAVIRTTISAGGQTVRRD